MRKIKLVPVLQPELENTQMAVPDVDVRFMARETAPFIVIDRFR